jgi:hypothetical protein
MTPKPPFPALGAPISPAWVHGSPHVKDLALPKSVELGNLSLNKVGIRWMSVPLCFCVRVVAQRHGHAEV